MRVFRFGRRDPLAVDHHGVETRFGAADEAESRLALVNGNGDTGDALHRVADVGVGEAIDLVSGHDVGDVWIRSLLVERGSLSLPLSHDYDLGQLCHRGPKPEGRRS